MKHLQEHGIDTRVLQATAVELLPILDGGEAGAAELATGLAEALRARADRGDCELAAQLDDRVNGRDSGRPRLPVRLLDLAELLEGSMGDCEGGVIDLKTGATWSSFYYQDADVDDQLDLEDDPDRWLGVSREVYSSDAWADMADFADSVADPVLRARLQDALDGRGAFSRFRRVVYDDEDYDDLWMAFQEERQLGRAVKWLSGTGYDVGVPRRL